MSNWTIRTTVDLQRLNTSRVINYSQYPLTYADNSAHAWLITVLDGYEPRDMEDYTINLYVRRNDGDTVVTPGTVAGNVVSCVFPAAAYACTGPALAVVRASLPGEQTLTLSNLAFTVERKDTDSIVDPDHRIPDIAELLAQIDAMEDATAAAQAVAEQSVIMRTGTTVSSLDDCTETGYYYLSGGNAPVQYASYAIVLNKGGGIISQVAFDTRAGAIYVRKLVSGAWTDWIAIQQREIHGIQWDIDLASQTIANDTYGPRTNKAMNITGTKLKIVTYNVAGWAKSGKQSGNPFIATKPDKLNALRAWLAQSDADVLFNQEYLKNLDGSSSSGSTAVPYIYNNRLPRTAGATSSNEPVAIIATKHAIVWNSGSNSVSIPPLRGGNNKKTFRWAMMNLNGKQIMLVSAHTMNSALTFDTEPVNDGPIADRRNFIAAMFDFIYCMSRQEMITDAIGSGDLKNITAPWDYCIIGGDFNLSNYNGKNSATGEWYPEVEATTDWNNFTAYRDYYKFDSANGGYLNWFQTYPGYTGIHSALDNILVSDNVLLQSIKCDRGLYDRLYSDHLPLEVTVTLLDDASGYGTKQFPGTTYEGYKYDDKALQDWFKAALHSNADGPCTPSQA